MPVVTALGGASAAPNPGQGCSGYLIGDDETGLVLDMGSGTLTELLRHRALNDLDGIVISHLHVDHMLDVIALWWGWLYHVEPLRAPIPLWLPPGGSQTLRRTLATLGRPDEVERFFGDIFDAGEYDPAAEVRVGPATLSFARTAHFVPCWAVRVELPHGVVAYTADTGLAADLTPLARGADLLIAESMLPVGSFEKSPDRGSSTPIEAAALARDARVERLMLTHFWSEQDADEALRQASRIFTGSIVVARPGVTVAW